MSDNMDRFWFLLLGVAIGYLIRTIQVSRRTVKRVDSLEEDVSNMKQHDERGQVTGDGLRSLASLAALALTVVAVFFTVQNNNTIADTTRCNKDAIEQTVTALNSRTSFTGEQLESQQMLNVAQKEFLETLLDTTSNTGQQQRLREYIRKLDESNRAIEKLRQQRLEVKYPTAKQIQECPVKRSDS